MSSNYKKIVEFLDDIRDVQLQYGLQLFADDFELEIRDLETEDHVAYLCHPEPVYDKDRVLVDDDGYKAHLETCREKENG